MKKNKSWFFLLGAIVLLGGYAAFDVFNEKKEEESKSAAAKILHLEKDQIVQVEIKRKDQLIVSLKKDQGLWQFLQPLKEEADSTAVQDFVDGAVLESSKELVKEGKDIDWKNFGLDDPKAEIHFATSSAKPVIILVSEIKNYAGDPYIRINTEDKVYSVSSTWTTRADKKLFDFRNKRLLKTPIANLSEFKIVSAKNKFEMEKKDDKWIANSFKESKLDPVKVSENIGLLNTISATDIVAEGDLSASELAKYSLDKPSFTVETSDGKEKFKFLLGAVKSNYYAYALSSKRVYQIPESDFKKFEKINFDSVRDRREAFNFEKDKVAKIEFSNSNLSAEFVKKGEDWALQNKDEKLVYQEDRPKAILSLVRNLEVSEFSPNPAEVKSNQQLNFKDESGKTIFQLIIEGQYKNQSKSYVRVKTNLLKNSVGVDEGTFKAIGLDSLVQTKSEKSANK